MNKHGERQFKLIMEYVEQQLEAEFRNTLPDSQAEDELFEKATSMGLQWLVFNWRDINNESRRNEQAKIDSLDIPEPLALDKTFGGK